MRSAGCGWNAGVLLDSIGACRDIVVRFVLDKNPVKWGKTFWGVLVRGGDDLLSALAEEGITHFIVGVGATTDNAARPDSLTSQCHIVCSHYRLFMLRRSVPSVHRSAMACKSWPARLW
jgi:hypothetical protein